MSTVVVRLAGLLGLLALTAACGSSGTPASATGAGGDLLEVSLPDVSRIDETVQNQVRERYKTLQETMARAGASPADRASAYGNLGMVLQAGEYYDSAEPAYLNAQRLAPNELRWPYYLGHLYRSKGEMGRAIAAFSRALEIAPNDAPTLIWLGRTYLDQGEPEKAGPMFERARPLAPRAVAVLAGLGQTALARRDFARAVTLLHEALEIDPSAASIYSPLAMAYRGLGKTDQAEAHLKQWRNTDILVPDPLRLELDLLLESGLSYELRGVRALEARDFSTAADLFRRGVAITPGESSMGRSLRHKLGTALYLSGDVRGAVRWFEETVKLAPETGIDETAAKAHYSLGVLMASAGRREEAVRHLAAAVRFSPTYVEAYQALADAQRRLGQVQQSMSSYAEAIKINPKSADARFGYGMALVRLGRYREARDWFDEAGRLHPDRLEFPHALARLLAAAPDAGVRDGLRAQALAEELFKGEKTTDLGETMAMTLAELGRFDEAAAIQRGVMEAARRGGFDVALKRMAANLQRYERRQPCRVPWPDDDPVHSPGPPVDPELRAALAAR